MDYRTENNNRSMRFLELIDAQERVDFDDLKRIKFDNQYPSDGTFLRSIAIIGTVDAEKYPDVKEILLSMQSWDKVAQAESYAASYYLVALTYIFEKNSLSDESFIDGVDLN
jgi:acyl-homoserine-lactone acylase